MTKHKRIFLFSSLALLLALSACYVAPPPAYPAYSYDPYYGAYYPYYYGPTTSFQFGYSGGGGRHWHHRHH